MELDGKSHWFFICVCVIIGGFQKNLIENKSNDTRKGDHPHPTVVKEGEGEKGNLLLALGKRFFVDSPAIPGQNLYVPFIIPS